MSFYRLGVILSLPLLVAGCDRSDEGDDSAGSGGTTVGDPLPQPTCELVSKTELADENEVAPNGQTGARILSALPESLHTSLHWDYSSLSGIEVEIPESVGLSSVLDLTFSLPAEPQFFFEDWTVVRPEGDYQIDVELVCHDLVTTTLDVDMVTDDGAISLSLTGLRVRLGPDRPDYDDVAKPYIHQTLAMATPEVNFLKPEALRASEEKTITMEFDYDGMSVAGDIRVYAEGSTATYEHWVAKW
jgi:hypothetical protein